MMAHLREIIADTSKADFAPFKLATADDFEYTDPIDGESAIPLLHGKLGTCLVRYPMLCIHQ